MRLHQASILSSSSPKRIPADGSPQDSAQQIIIGVAIFWALFQLWYASPLPFIVGFGVFNDTEARAIHLGLALFLAFTAYPAFKSSPRAYVPVIDWALALAGAFAGAYLFLFYTQVALRPGQPTTLDLVTAGAGILLLLEATRRSLGLPMVFVATFFILFTFAGPYMPESFSTRGHPFRGFSRTSGSSPRACSASHSVYRRASSSCSCCSERCWTRPAAATG